MYMRIRYVKNATHAGFLAVSRAVAMGVLATIVASGGAYGAYRVWDTRDTSGANPNTVYAKEVLDGDTLKLENGDVVRLAGIDAPELGTCYSDESRLELTKLVMGKPLSLVHDVTGADKMGRLVRWVVASSGDARKDNMVVQHELVRRGYATAVTGKDKLYQKILEDATWRARSEGAGMWGVGL